MTKDSKLMGLHGVLKWENNGHIKFLKPLFHFHVIRVKSETFATLGAGGNVDGV